MVEHAGAIAAVVIVILLVASGLAYLAYSGGGLGGLGANGAKGDKGDTGATGPQGPQGLQGLTGQNGANGANGATGPMGSPGPSGAPGSAGATGATGAAGANGLNGNNGLMTCTYLINSFTNGTGTFYQAIRGNDSTICWTSTNATTLINEALVVTPNNSVIQFVGNFTLDGVIFVQNKTNIILQGPAWFVSSASRTMVVVGGYGQGNDVSNTNKSPCASTGVTIQYLSFDGTTQNAGLSIPAAFEYNSTAVGGAINFVGMYNSGMYATAGTSMNAYVQYCNFWNVGNDVVLGSDASNVTVQYNNFYNTRAFYAAIHFHDVQANDNSMYNTILGSSTGAIRHGTQIIGNVISGCGNASLTIVENRVPVIMGGDTAWSYHNDGEEGWVIANNVINASSFDAIDCWTGPGTVKDNTITFTNGTGILVADTTQFGASGVLGGQFTIGYVAVTGNKIIGFTGTAANNIGIYVLNATNSQVNNNQVTFEGYRGALGGVNCEYCLDISTCTNCQFNLNSLRYCAAGGAIMLVYGTNNCEFSQNQVYGGYYGMNFDNSVNSFNLVTGNYISGGQTYDCIRFSNSADLNNTISGNYLIGAGRDGIFLVGSNIANTFVTGNYIANFVTNGIGDSGTNTVKFGNDINGAKDA